MSIKAKRFRAQPMSRLLEGAAPGDGELAGLMRTARVLDEAQRYLRAHLPEDMREHIFVGGYRQGKLTLITDRAVWLTWLRYEQTRLLQLLRQLPAFQAVMGFTLKVRPISPPRTPRRQERALSSRAADELSSCAADIENPQLRQALKRLAAHAETDALSTSQDRS